MLNSNSLKINWTIWVKGLIDRVISVVVVTSCSFFPLAAKLGKAMRKLVSGVEDKVWLSHPGN